MYMHFDEFVISNNNRRISHGGDLLAHLVEVPARATDHEVSTIAVVPMLNVRMARVLISIRTSRLSHFARTKVFSCNKTTERVNNHEKSLPTGIYNARFSQLVEQSWGTRYGSLRRLCRLGQHVTKFIALDRRCLCALTQLAD